MQSSPLRSPGAPSPRQLYLLARSQQRAHLPLPDHNGLHLSPPPAAPEQVQRIATLMSTPPAHRTSLTPTPRASNIRTLGGHIRRGSAAPLATSPPQAKVSDQQHLLHDLNAMEEVRLGSFVYDAVSDVFLCHVNHCMVPLSLEAYKGLGCVSATCDGCTRHVQFEAVVEPQPEVGTKRPRANKKKAHPDTSTDPYFDTSYFLTYDPSSVWFRCVDCDTDMCAECGDTIRSTEQFVVPYAECRQCGLKMRTADAIGHQCTTHVAWPTLTTSATTAPTVSIKSELIDDFTIFSPLRSPHGDATVSRLETLETLVKEEDKAEMVGFTLQYELRWEVSIFDIPHTGTAKDFAEEYIRGTAFAEEYRCALKQIPRCLVVSFADRQRAADFVKYARRTPWRARGLRPNAPEKVKVPTESF